MNRLWQVSAARNLVGLLLSWIFRQQLTVICLLRIFCVLLQFLNYMHQSFGIKTSNVLKTFLYPLTIICLKSSPIYFLYNNFLLFLVSITYLWCFQSTKLHNLTIIHHLLLIFYIIHPSPAFHRLNLLIIHWGNKVSVVGTLCSRLSVTNQELPYHICLTSSNNLKAMV